jgi:hypothetical protein
LAAGAPAVGMVWSWVGSGGAAVVVSAARAAALDAQIATQVASKMRMRTRGIV